MRGTGLGQQPSPSGINTKRKTQCIAGSSDALPSFLHPLVGVTSLCTAQRPEINVNNKRGCSTSVWPRQPINTADAATRGYGGTLHRPRMMMSRHGKSTSPRRVLQAHSQDVPARPEALASVRPDIGIEHSNVHFRRAEAAAFFRFLCLGPACPPYFLLKLLSGSPLFPPRPPLPPLPPLFAPSPFGRAFFLYGTYLLSPALFPPSVGAAGVSSLLEAEAPPTGAMRGMRYEGTCFMCDCTREGCRGLSCLRKARSRGLSSKWA